MEYVILGIVLAGVLLLAGLGLATAVVQALRARSATSHPHVLATSV